MSPVSKLGTDGRILWRLLRGQPRRGSPAERLQAFYAPQAERYDEFRSRLLHGREAMIARLDLQPGEHVVELGCGTGSSLSRIGRRVGELASVQMVDLCPALLEIARQRASGYGNVQVIEADATLWQPAVPVDCVLMSYALTMIPDWPKVVANARAMLRPGGRIGIVDFHLPADGSPLSNGLWRRWFAHDGVHLSNEHLPALRRSFVEMHCQSARGKIPYLPGLSAPYYWFIGRRPE